ncbi:MAG TPA: ABC transporter permease [Pyrinomonadaceae bacterium]|nr:ABC transporter permease [Pyrinomonadaceae bacterium]
MRTLIQDLRFGARGLLKNPAFTAVAVLALALGVAANTAIFSVVHAVILNPLPYREAGRLAMVWEHNRPRDQHQNVINPANFLDWKEQTDVFEDMAAFYDSRLNLTGAGEPGEVTVQFANSNLLSLLGAEPLVGRNFTPEDARPDAPSVVIISHALWQSRFGGDPAAVGRTLRLNGGTATVIGVMPSGFQFFVRKGSLAGKPADMWSPFGWTEQNRIRRGRYMSAVARLKPGVTSEQAQAQLNQLAARLEEQHPQFNKGWGVEVVTLRDQLSGELRPALWVLLGAVGFLLLIACANVANLLLARGAARQKEIALRTALGATRGRIVRQLLTESLLLAAAGGAAGLALAWWGVELLAAFSPRDLVDLGNVRLNLPVLGFTLLVALLTGVVFGLAPALEATRHDTNETLKEGGRGGTSGRRRARLRGGFVVTEVALALVLLVGAGLMLKSFARLQSVSPGFEPEGVLTMRVVLPGSKYNEPQKVTAFFRQAVERLRSLPGVESAAAVSFLPLTGPAAATRFNITGRPEPPPEQNPVTDVRVTDENFFRVMRIPLLRGRTYDEREAMEARRVVVVNEALARKYFPGEDPIGQRILVRMRPDQEPTEIVGVVGDVKHKGLDAEANPTVYWPHPELPYNGMSLVVRAKGDPATLGAAAQREIQALDPEQPVADVRTMTQWMAESIGRARFSAQLLAVFAVLALVLATVGIYGVISYSVTQRTHELGVRIALGAQRSDVLRLVVGQGLALAAIGLATGLAGAFGLTRLMRSLLYEVSTTDPLTYAGLSLFLLLVALAACYIPARRATKVDPMEALRYE